MTRSKRRIDKISAQEAEIVDSQYAIFLNQAEQLFSWMATKEYLSVREFAINRVSIALKNGNYLDDSDKNDIAGAFFALWYFGTVYFDEHYTDDCLNACLCLLSPSTCISYSTLIDSLGKASVKIAKLIENGSALEADRHRQTIGLSSPQGSQNDLF